MMLWICNFQNIKQKINKNVVSVPTNVEIKSHLLQSFCFFVHLHNIFLCNMIFHLRTTILIFHCKNIYFSHITDVYSYSTWQIFHLMVFIYLNFYPFWFVEWNEYLTNDQPHQQQTSQFFQCFITASDFFVYCESI